MKWSKKREPARLLLFDFHIKCFQKSLHYYVSMGACKQWELLNFPNDIIQEHVGLRGLKNVRQRSQKNSTVPKWTQEAVQEL